MELTHVAILVGIIIGISIGCTLIGAYSVWLMKKERDRYHPLTLNLYSRRRRTNDGFESNRYSFSYRNHVRSPYSPKPGEFVKNNRLYTMDNFDDIKKTTEFETDVEYRNYNQPGKRVIKFNFEYDSNED